MADISTYLAAILAAVYGEDVRGSIHDAIELINDVSEVVLTTGTAVTSASSSSTGFYKDSLYLNTNTFELWKCMGTDTWASQGTLKGDNGVGISGIAKTSTSGLVDTYTITFDDGSTETFDVTNGADGQNGSKWYKGTAISGTGTSITGFPGVKDDFYLNSANGNVYVCTKSGGASVPDPAEWDYVMTLVGGGGGGSINVIDSLTSTSSTDALSANQGRVLKGLVDGKASSDPPFVEAGTRQNIVSGETLSVLFGKIKKWFSDLKGLAFIDIDSVSSTKLLQGDGTWVNAPTVNNGALNITKNKTDVSHFYANQSNATNLSLDFDEFVAQGSPNGGTVVFNNIDDTLYTGPHAYDVYFDVTNNSTNMNPYAKLKTNGISGEGTSSMSLTYETDADNGTNTAHLRLIK